MDIRAKETVLGHVGNITKYSDVKTNDVKIVQPDGSNLTTAKAGWRSMQCWGALQESGPRFLQTEQSLPLTNSPWSLSFVGGAAGPSPLGSSS